MWLKAHFTHLEIPRKGFSSLLAGDGGGTNKRNPSMWPGRREGVPSRLSVSLSCCGPSTSQPFLPDLSTTFPGTPQRGRPGICSSLPAAVLLFLFRCFLMFISVPFKWALVKSYRVSMRKVL